MKFSYLKVPSADPTRKWISRPIIPVIVHGPSGSIAIDALIDSGADRSLFHVSIAEEIGIKPETGVKEIFSGIEAGHLQAWLHKIKLGITGMARPIELTAGFVDSSGVSAILGQDGFFDNYRIKFEKDRNTIEINPIL